MTPTQYMYLLQIDTFQELLKSQYNSLNVKKKKKHQLYKIITVASNNLILYKEIYI